MCRVWEKRAGVENDGSAISARRLIILLAGRALSGSGSTLTYFFATFYAACLALCLCWKAHCSKAGNQVGFETASSRCLRSGDPLSEPKLVFISLNILHTAAATTTPLQASRPSWPLLPPLSSDPLTVKLLSNWALCTTLLRTFIPQPDSSYELLQILWFFTWFFRMWNWWRCSAAQVMLHHFGMSLAAQPLLAPNPRVRLSLKLGPDRFAYTTVFTSGHKWNLSESKIGWAASKNVYHLVNWFLGYCVGNNG